MEHPPEEKKSTTVTKVAEFIASWEGLHLTPYIDTEMLAICYGHRSFEGDRKTEAECWDMMMTSAEILVKYISEIYTRELTENQIVSLSSLHYNVKNPSDVIWRANNGYSDQSVANSIRQYTYAGGVQLRGLVNRRNAEAELFLKN